MIYLLTILLFIIFFIAYKVNYNSFFSITVISSLSFLVSSLFYCLSFNIFGSDISFKCLLVIVLSLIFMLGGEWIGRNIYVKKSSKSNSIMQNAEKNIIYDESMDKMIFIFVIMLIIFFIRFYDLYKFSLSKGNGGGIWGVIATVRLSYALGEYTGSGILIRAAIYATLLCEIYAYLYTYYFLHDFVNNKVVRKRLLLPLAGYIIIAISFTSRTQFIKCAVMVIWMYMYLLYRQGGSKKKNNNELVRRVIWGGTIFVAFLFIYATMTRNSENSGNIFQVLASYISAPLYGLSVTIDGTIYGINAQEKEFGYYTLQNIHRFLNNFGFDYDVPSFHNLPFFYYARGSSNIYTALLYPIQDYGIRGMLGSRFFLGILVGVLEKNVFRMSGNKASNLTFVIFMGIIYYDAISTYIADRYYDDLLDINALIKYTLFAYIVIKFWGKCKRKWCKYEIDKKNISEMET